MNSQLLSIRQRTLRQVVVGLSFDDNWHCILQEIELADKTVTFNTRKKTTGLFIVIGRSGRKVALLISPINKLEYMT